ncbi:MAG: hypothetical protein FVQ77_10310, partial [Cytophagales bacterium]|nr:hypothetical protein [Cytophagales bacterium]
MKKSIICLLVLLLGVLNASNVKASHAAGADISYECLGGNTFRVQLSFYRDCDGVSAPTSPNVNYSSASCGISLSGTANLVSVTEIIPYCPAALPTQCSSGAPPSREQHIYEIIVVLPATCTDWVFSYSVNCRNNIISTINPTCVQIYVEARLNNTITPCNNSPFFTNPPAPFVYVDQRFCYNNGAVDLDGDSLVYYLITPKTGAGLGNTVNYISPYTKDQPLTSDPPVTFDPKTGDICMLPTDTNEVTVMAVLVQEYRSGTFVGSVIRDIQINVISGSDHLPFSNGINGTSLFRDTIAADSAYSFTINTFDVDIADFVTIISNVSVAVPAASFSSSGGARPDGTFSWTPSVSDIRTTPYCFTTTVQDDACPVNGYEIKSYCIVVDTLASVPGGYTAQQLAEVLAGPGFTVSNATLIGGSVCSGVFDATNSNLGAGTGVILCTGNIKDALRPNSSTNTSTSNGQPGTTELTAIAGVFTFDACVLEFDFEVQTEFITFNYVFASEEYPEFVGSSFNDVFAFWIAGPGISGWENIALIPNTTTPVTINNVNDSLYWQYYIDNTGGTTVEYDGFTTLLTAQKNGLIPCEIYTLRLAIADADDRVFDSGVFLEENSLIQGTVDAQTNTINADNVALEGCIKASFTFTIDTIKTTPTVINYGIGGTATNGVDYVFIDSSMTIPAGQTSATIIIDALGDGIPEPQEVIELYFLPTPCTPIDTVFLYIDDAEPINFSLSGTDLACTGDSSGVIDATITGGFPPYNITLNGQYTFDSVPITNLPADTYLVSIRDIYGCDADAIVTGGVDTAGLTFLPDGDGNVYTSPINVSAFDPLATLTDVSMLQSVCIRIEHSFLGDLEIKLIAPDSTEIILKEHPGSNTTNLGEPVAKGPKDGANPDSTAGICYEYCWTSNPTYGTFVAEAGNYTYTYTDVTGKVLSDKYLPSGSYQPFQPFSGLLGVPLNGGWTVWVKDNMPQDNGYICSWSISLSSDLPDSIVIISEPNAISMSDSTTFATCGDTNGAVDVTVAGDFPPFTYSWNTGETTEDISNIGAGTYTLSATDSNGCTSTADFLVQNISSMVLSATAGYVTCNGSSDGSIDLTVSSGVIPYTFAWDNGPITEDIFGLTAGNYTVTVTDSVGCISLKTITITQPDVVVINAVTLSNEKCGEVDGAIDIAVAGGTPPNTYNWSNGEATSAIDSLSAGDYSVTVTDSNGCIAIDTFTLINEVGNCVIYCYIEINNILVTDEVCGNSSGAIDISVINGTQPFNYSWSNGEITEDISGLTAGDYSVTVTGADGCEADDTITVNNSTGSLAITGTVVSNESCGNGQGSIDNTISGGVLPYAYIWSDGQTTEDATGLGAGNYSCTITDANGCSINMNVDVLNDAGTLVQTWGNAMDELCGNGLGSIDITISGGVLPYSYLWTNGATTEDLLNLSAGIYSCTITDWNGCQITTPTYTINNVAGTLAIFDIDVFNEICSNGAGSINLDITGGTIPYSFAWNTGATTEDLTGLSAGTYSCQVSDANSCSVNTGDIVLFNSPGTLILDDIFVVDENCNNNQGYINITISGGVAPYTFAWSNGSTS